MNALCSTCGRWHAVEWEVDAARVFGKRVEAKAFALSVRSDPPDERRWIVAIVPVKVRALGVVVNAWLAVVRCRIPCAERVL